MGGGRGTFPRLAAAAAAVVALGACSGPPGGLLQRPASPGPGSIDAFVPQAVRFVESHRGLKFKQQVKVRHLSDRAFTDRVIQLQRQSQTDLRRQAKVLRALGLIEPALDAEKAEEELLRSGVVGFYEPTARELEVRGDTATLSVEHVVVHELTHALQDQWFGLDTTGSSGNDDADLAYTALVEGDAVRIETAYVSSLPAKEQRDLRDQEAAQGGPPSDVPQVLLELLQLPYVAGPPFTEAVLKAKGRQGLDAAFDAHPASSSQVLHPERYLAADVPAMVPEPASDGPVFDRGSLGEATLRFLFEPLVRTGGLTGAQVLAAGAGWSGDRYAGWSRGADVCIRDRIATRTPADAAAMLTALHWYAQSRPGVTIDESTPQPVLTACG